MNLQTWQTYLTHNFLNSKCNLYFKREVHLNNTANVVYIHINFRNSFKILFSSNIWLRSEQSSRPGPFNDRSLDLEGRVSGSKGNNWSETFKYLKNSLRVNQLNQKF